MLRESALHFFHHVIRATAPDCLIHDFDFNGTGVTGCFHGVSQATQLDYARSIMLRPAKTSGSGTAQSETWNAKIRPAHFRNLS